MPFTASLWFVFLCLYSNLWYVSVSTQPCYMSLSLYTNLWYVVYIWTCSMCLYTQTCNMHRSMSLNKPVICRYLSTQTSDITITIYFINPSGKLKLSFDRTTKNISQYSKSWTTRTYTLLDIRPLSLNLHTLILSNSKPKITWNNAFSVSNQNVKTLKLNKNH